MRTRRTLAFHWCSLLTVGCLCLVPSIPARSEHVLSPVVSASDTGLPPAEVIIRLPGDIPLVMVRLPDGGPEQVAASCDADGSADRRTSKEALRSTYVLKAPLSGAQWQALMGSSEGVLEHEKGREGALQLTDDNLLGPKGFLARLTTHLSKGAADLTPEFRAATESETRRAEMAGLKWADAPRLLVATLPMVESKTSLALTRLAACTTGSAQTFGCNRSTTGSLTTSDCTLSDGSHADLYSVPVTAGQTLTIDLTSSAFDAFLLLLDSSGSSLAFNDDYSGLNSRIVYTMSSSGTVYVVANSLSVSGTGSYSLSVQCSGGGENPCPVANITCGASVNGTLSTSDCTLSDGSYADMYSFPATAGRAVQIDMSSSAFDTYLMLANSSLSLLASNDDGGGGLNSRITYTPTSSGTLVIIANSLSAGAAGSYNVALQCATPNVTLTVVKAGTGQGTVTSSPSGINCGSTCTASYASGTTVTLTATPSSGSTFSGWSGACSGTGACTVSLTAARSVTATFAGGGFPTIANAMMTKAIPTGDCGTVLPSPATAFASTDTAVFLYFRISGFQNGEGLSSVWSDPNGQIHVQGSWDPLSTQYSSYCMTSRMNLAGTAAANKPGLWRVRVFSDKILDVPYVDLTFTVTSGGGDIPVAGTWLLTSSARVQGAGAFWQTDLSIRNTGTTSAAVTLKFLGHSGDGRGGPERSATIAAGQTQTWRDVLGTLFGLSSEYGPILVRSTSASLAILGQTWTAGGAGTYGQSVPVLSTSELIGITPRSILGVRQDAFFRTNLMLANATETTTAVTVQLVSTAGAVLATKSVSLGPLSRAQYNVGTDFGYSNVSDAVFVISSPTSGAAVGAYASVIDASTADPRTLLPR